MLIHLLIGVAVWMAASVASGLMFGLTSLPGEGKPSDGERLIDGSTTTGTSVAAAVVDSDVAAILRRQYSGYIRRQGDVQPRPDFVERPGGPNLTGHPGISGIRVDDAPSRQPSTGRQVNQVQTVVFAQPQGRDEPFRRSGAQPRPRSGKVRTQRDVRATVAMAGLWLDNTSQGRGDREVRINDEHRSQWRYSEPSKRIARASLGLKSSCKSKKSNEFNRFRLHSELLSHSRGGSRMPVKAFPARLLSRSKRRSGRRRPSVYRPDDDIDDDTFEERRGRRSRYQSSSDIERRLFGDRPANRDKSERGDDGCQRGTCVVHDELSPSEGG